MQDEEFMYRHIADEIRAEILEGRLRPGERMPAIRASTQRWNCTPGTIQRAYKELARQGLILSQAGRGTHVTTDPQPLTQATLRPLRRAALVNRAEAFLLESLTAGHTLEDVQNAFQLALDRWRSLPVDEPGETGSNSVLRFSGSHDLAVVWIAGHAPEILPGATLQLQFCGSLGGLMMLAQEHADLAGSHLWDPDSNTYNSAYIRRIFPGKTMLAVRLAVRRTGLIVAPGNPLHICDLADLTQPGVRFLNRQGGSGTRVWLDTQLARQGIAGGQIAGYDHEVPTHTEIARAVAEGKVDVGLGLESSAAAFGLDFVHLTDEAYDLVMDAAKAESGAYHTLLTWLASPEAKTALASLKGYDTSQTGERMLI
jgi:molybdate-binding protein/DNA-binding transcriptional regulator YhcF (GntR family)